MQGGGTEPQDSQIGQTGGRELFCATRRVSGETWAPHSVRGRMGVRKRFLRLLITGVGMLAQEAHQRVFIDRFPVLIFCNINDKGDDKEPIDY